MKKLFIVFLLSSFYVNGQGIKISKLIDLRTENIISIEESLTLDGWIYAEGSKSTSDSLGYIAFELFLEGTNPQYFFFYFREDSDTTRIQYQIFDFHIYQGFLEELKNLNFKLISSKFDSDKSIIKFYRKNDDIIKIVNKVGDISKNRQTPKYLLTVLDYNDYLQYYE